MVTPLNLNIQRGQQLLVITPIQFLTCLDNLMEEQQKIPGCILQSNDLTPFLQKCNSLLC